MIPGMRRPQRPQRPMGSGASNRMGTGMFRNRGGRAGGGGNRGMGFATGGVGAAAGALGGGPPGSPGPTPTFSQPAGEGGGYDPGAAAGALMGGGPTSGPTTYTAQNDPLLMENVGNLRKRMSADVTTAQKQKARADIATDEESQRKKLATMAARSGGAGAMNEMAGDLADSTMRKSAGAMTDIGINAEKRLDDLTIGGQGIMAAPGGRNLDERRFQSDVDARLASNALQRDAFNAGNYWQGQNFNAGREDAQFNQGMQVAQFGRQRRRGGFGGGRGGRGIGGRMGAAGSFSGFGVR